MRSRLVPPIPRSEVQNEPRPLSIRLRDYANDWCIRAGSNKLPLEAADIIDELTEALQPFAKYARDGGVEGWNNLEFPPNVKDFVSLGDFRRALTVLSSQEGAAK